MRRRTKGLLLTVGIDAVVFLGFWLWLGLWQGVIAVLGVQAVSWAAAAGNREARGVEEYRRAWLQRRSRSKADRPEAGEGPPA
ncbi:hypothetical protein OIT41_02545 [Arthrobacter sp. YA7-1]|uniref:hypothetical protein n=1 Tax=Arthrobacter sp. YA7-1 TaxID=2987701 RepID=UPI0022265315|nr:hypothetical protein [Arthrobacter sp. YA7-1]UYY81975.1 hypothetical protein OIT41_02545 [Arthrobacter sp. YA7-1]